MTCRFGVGETAELPASAPGEPVSPPPQGADYIAVQESLGDFEEAFPFEVPVPLVSDHLAAGAVA